jgi:hypothetical protein
MSISMEPYDEADFRPITPEVTSTKKPAARRYADLQGEMVYVRSGDDPFNNAVSFGQDEDERYALAEMMPEGFDDTDADRERALESNPKDDNALLAPRREELDEFIDATQDLRRRQAQSHPTGRRHLGAQSLLWPPLGDDVEEKDDGRTSYADYEAQDRFDAQTQAAQRRSLAASVFQ